MFYSMLKKGNYIEGYVLDFYCVCSVSAQTPVVSENAISEDDFQNKIHTVIEGT